MIYDIQNRKAVKKNVDDLKTVDDPRMFQRHLDEIGKSMASALGQVEPVIIDLNDIVAVGNTRVLSLKGTGAIIECDQFNMDEDGRAYAAWLSNNLRYAPSVTTDAVYLNRIIESIQSREQCSKTEAIKIFHAETGVEESYIRGQLAHYRPQTEAAIAKDKELPESKKVNPTTGLTLLRINEVTGIETNAIQEKANETKITSKQARWLAQHIQELKPSSVMELEKQMNDVKDDTTSITLLVRKTWVATLKEMGHRSMDNYLKEKMNTKQTELF